MANDGQSNERRHVSGYVPNVRESGRASVDEGPETL